MCCWSQQNVKWNIWTTLKKKKAFRIPTKPGCPVCYVIFPADVQAILWETNCYQFTFIFFCFGKLVWRGTSEVEEHCNWSEPAWLTVWPPPKPKITAYNFPNTHCSLLLSCFNVVCKLSSLKFSSVWAHSFSDCNAGLLRIPKVDYESTLIVYFQ